MKTRPLIVAASGPGQPPPPAPAFLQGNGLPGRWAGRARFTVLETGFGHGHNFIATWAAWRQHPQRCERLFYVAIEARPPARADLAASLAARPPAGVAPTLAQDLARALALAWPPLTPNLHALDFDDGRVQLLLALGDVATLLPALRVQADAFYLTGAAPPAADATGPPWPARLLKALGRKAAPGSTLAAWATPEEVGDSLADAGFVIQPAPGPGSPRRTVVGHWQPRFVPPALPTAAVPAARDAVVVGAGIAGAAVAQALARLGLAVTVIERQAQPATEASGNPAGLFHGTVHPDDGPYARLYRAAALQAQRTYGQALQADRQVSGSVDGLLRLDLHPGAGPAQQALLQAQGLPQDYVQALSAAAAAQHVGVPLNGPAWWYPGGGWLAPSTWVRHALAAPGVRLRTSAIAHSLSRHDGQWQVRSDTGQLLASAPVLVLASAASAARLLATLGPGLGALGHLTESRGQVTWWSDGPATVLRRPVAGDGYAIPLPGGGLLCGATRHLAGPADASRDCDVRDADHWHNVQRLQRLTGLAAPDAAPWHGRTGWRLHTDDRLPIAGAMPKFPGALAAFAGALPDVTDATAQVTAARPQPAGAAPVHGRRTGQRADQARLWPRAPGLFVLTALGARGLTLAPLLGRLLAAQATGTPWPLEQDLADAIDPVRWQVRAARGQAPGEA